MKVKPHMVKNGDGFPKYWYINAPRGGPDIKPVMDPATAILNALSLSAESAYLLLTALLPVNQL